MTVGVIVVLTAVNVALIGVMVELTLLNVGLIGAIVELILLNVGLILTCVGLIDVMASIVAVAEIGMLIIVPDTGTVGLKISIGDCVAGVETGSTSSVTSTIGATVRVSVGVKVADIVDIMVGEIVCVGGKVSAGPDGSPKISG